MDDADREILDHFVRARAATIEMVRRTPNDLLTRAAESEPRPVGAVFAHIANGVGWWMHNVLCDGQGPPPRCKHDEASLIRALEASRDRLVRFVSADDGRRMGETFSIMDSDGSTSSWTGRNRVLYLTDHEVHHRGRIQLALWQFGLTDFPCLLA